MDEHIIEAMGKAKITIQDGKVIKVEEPLIEYCPLFHKHRGIAKLDKESIKKNMEFRINDFGMCSPNREVKMKDFLSFGISEILSTLLNENVIDCAIMVCEGCGTVIITDGEMAQGVGGRVSGLMKTAPIKEVIEKIGMNNILDPKLALIDQIEGVKSAISKGYNNIAVTIANSNDGKILRELEKEYKENHRKINIYIFSVHTTGVNEEEAEKLFNYCDIITACASKAIREIGDKIATKQVGESIPIYAATKKGKKFLELRVGKIGGMKPKKDPKSPEPLI
jgi:putative methanogenesis marker protein 8